MALANVYSTDTDLQSPPATPATELLNTAVKLRNGSQLLHVLASDPAVDATSRMPSDMWQHHLRLIAIGLSTG